MVRRQAGERGRLALAQGAQFRHLRLEHRGDNRTDAGNLLEALGARFHGLVGGALRGDGARALCDLPLQQGEQLAALLAQQLVGIMLCTVELGGARFHELGAAANEHFEVTLRRARRRGRRGLDRCAKGDEHVGIDDVGLGVLAFGAGKMPHPRGLDDAQDPAGKVQHAAERDLLAAGGLEDDMDLAARPRRLRRGEQLEEAGMAFGIVGQAVGRAAEAELQRGLGNVDAGVEGGGEVVLTHPCLMRAARAVHPQRRSINGSSLDQWMSDAACSATHRNPPLGGACWRRARLIRSTAALVAIGAAASFYFLPMQTAQRAMPTYKEAEGNRGGGWEGEPDTPSTGRRAAPLARIFHRSV